MSWTLIEHQALSSSAASVTLGSGGTIPQTYKTLKLVMSVRVTGASGNLLVQPNNASTNLTYRLLEGDGAAAASYNNTTGRVAYAQGSSTTANTFASIETTFPNYASTTANKAYSSDAVSENNGTTAYQDLTATLWAQTAAITSLVISGSSNLEIGSTFTLYGLA